MSTPDADISDSVLLPAILLERAASSHQEMVLAVLSVGVLARVIVVDPMV